MREQILQTYGNMVLIQSELGLLHETAVKVRDGELEGFESFGALIAVASLVNAIDENLPQIGPVPPLTETWDEMLAIHESVKDVTARWFNKDIASPEVIEELTPLMADVEEIMSRAEARLTQVYGLPQKELEAWRCQAVEDLSSAFDATPTPTPGS